MLTLKKSLLVIASASAVFGATSASALSFEVWDSATSSWKPNGTTHLVGGTTASYIGNALPCNADNFTVVVTAGVATITAVTFGNSPASTACSGIVSKGLPWKVTPNSTTSITIGDAASTTTATGGVHVDIPSPLNAKCPNVNGRAPLAATVTNPTGTPPGVATVTFSGALGPCSVASTGTGLKTTGFPSIRVIP